MELLCVMAILSVLAAAALPKIHFAAGAELDRSAAQLAADLRWLQQRSINISRGHSALPKAPKDAVPRMRITAGVGGGYSISAGSAILKQFHFVGTVQIYANYTAIMFDNDGRLNPPLTIRMQEGNRTRSVIIDVAGRIRVE